MAHLLLKRRYKTKKIYISATTTANQQVQQFSVLSYLLLLLTTTTFTRKIEHKSEVLSTATANVKNFARNNTSMVESEDIKHSHLAFF